MKGVMIGRWDNRRERKAEEEKGRKTCRRVWTGGRGGGDEGRCVEFYKGNVCPPFAAVGRERDVRAAGREELLGKGWELYPNVGEG